MARVSKYPRQGEQLRMDKELVNPEIEIASKRPSKVPYIRVPNRSGLLFDEQQLLEFWRLPVDDP
jgi:hypothetical protein